MGSARHPALGVWIVSLLWLIAFGLSVVLALNTVPTGSGFTRGMNRVGTFFRWQFLAFAIAISNWMIARGRSDLSNAVRGMARVPIVVQSLLGLAGLLIVILVAVFK